MKTRLTMIKVVDQALLTGSNTTSPTLTLTPTTNRLTCGRITTAALRPNSPTISTHNHPRLFLFSSISRSLDRMASMQVHDRALMEMSYHRVQSLVNRCSHTAETFSQLEAGSLPLGRVVLRESHLCWKVRVLRPPFAAVYPHPAS